MLPGWYGAFGQMYVMLEDVVRYQRFVDARVFIRFEMDEGILRDALVYCFSYTPEDC